MYIAQTVKDRIKFLCKRKKIDMETMLVECSLGVNSIRQITDTKGMASFSLAKIADYLNCSVDYLLGRTDEPYMVREHSIQTGSIGDNSSNNDTSVKISDKLQHEQLDETTQQLVQAFKTLGFIEKSKVMGLVAELISK